MNVKMRNPPSPRLRRTGCGIMKLWKCENMKLLKYESIIEFEKGKIHSPTPTRYFNLLAALGVCIFAYFHIPTFAYCDAVAGPARDFCGWGALAPVALPAEWPLKSN